MQLKTFKRRFYPALEWLIHLGRCDARIKEYI